MEERKGGCVSRSSSGEKAVRAVWRVRHYEEDSEEGSNKDSGRPNPPGECQAVSGQPCRACRPESQKVVAT